MRTSTLSHHALTLQSIGEGFGAFTDLIAGPRAKSPLRAHRDAVLCDVLGLTLATVDGGLLGWTGDRLAEVGAADADLMETDESHRPFIGWAAYRARLLKHGKAASFRPRRPL